MRRGGFTLVEVVVAASIGVLVAAAALTALAAVFRGWTRLASGGALLDVDRAMLRVERDVASAFPLPGASFEGAADRLRFPLERGGALFVVEWTAGPQGLLRTERDYRFDAELGFDGREDDGRTAALRNERYRLPGPAVFSYAEDDSDEESEFADSWMAASPTNLPARVRFHVPGGPFRDMPCRMR